MFTYKVSKKVNTKKQTVPWKSTETHVSYVVYQTDGTTYTPIAEFPDFSDQRYHRGVRGPKQHAEIFARAMSQQEFKA